MAHTEYRHSPPPRQETLTEDSVNRPSHYTRGSIEVISVIEDQKLGYHLGNVIKYVLRAGHKEDEIEDLKKARWYLDRHIQNRERDLFKAIVGGS